MVENFDFTIYYDDGDSYSNFDPCTLACAIDEVGDSENCCISTSIGGIDVFEDGTWLMPREEAEAIAAKELAEKANAEAAKTAAIAAERATFGDAEDKANIAFIRSICAKRPARDYSALKSAEEIGSHSGWSSEYCYKGTVAYVWHNGRKYMISMWRGDTNVEREATIR